MVGTTTVGFVGLAGRELAGPITGLVAAGLAAAYPFLWVVDGSLMSETLYGALLAATMWLAIRFARRPSLGLAAGMGALVALAALTRGEALLLRRCSCFHWRCGRARGGDRGSRWPRWRSEPLCSCSRPGRSATSRSSTSPC